KAADEHRSESSVITEAVKAYFRPRDHETENAITQRYMGRIDARLEKVVGEGLILKEVMLLFIRVWLEHNPPIDEALEESAAMSAEARFERFLEMVAQALRGGQSAAHEGLPFVSGQALPERREGDATP